MATNRWIYDGYYVDGSEIRVHDCWIYSDGGTYNYRYPNGRWFYMYSNGRMVRGGWRTINNQCYYFDSDGTMQNAGSRKGIICTILETDGTAKTGWLCLDYDEYESQEDGLVSPVSMWFVYDEEWMSGILRCILLTFISCPKSILVYLI